MRIVEPLVSPFQNLAASMRRRRARLREAWRDLLVEIVAEPDDQEARRWREIRHTIHSTIWRLAVSAAGLLAIWSWLR